MRPTFSKTFVCAALAFCICASSQSSASTPVTAAQAIASLKFLSGTWHCTGDGPPEDDVYVFTKNVWRDTDTSGGVTTGTFDAKRQKWVVFSMNANGEYAVSEASPMVKDSMHVTIPYPASMSSHSYTFAKISESEFRLGKQICVKK